VGRKQRVGPGARQNVVEEEQWGSRSQRDRHQFCLKLRFQEGIEANPRKKGDW